MTHLPPASQDDYPEAIHVREAGPIAEAGRLGRWVDAGGLLFAVAFVVSMAILIVEIFMRYALGSPTLWAHETTIFLCAIAFIYGGLYCTARDSHIRVVLIYDHLGPRWRTIFDVVISLLCMASALFFAYASWLMVRRAFWAPSGEIRLETTGSAWNPPTPALLKGMLLVVMIILAVQFLILAINYLRRSRRA